MERWDRVEHEELGFELAPGWTERPYPSVDDIMNGAATFSGDEVTADQDETILAVRVERGCGVAFDFAVYSDGQYAADGKIAVRRSDGHWEELSEGGTWGDHWPTPWRPERDHWDDGSLLVLGQVGQQVDDVAEPRTGGPRDEPEEEVYVLGVYGFAARERCVDSRRTRRPSRHDHAVSLWRVHRGRRG